MHKRIPVTRAVTKKTDWNNRILNITLAKVNDAYLLLQLFHLKSTSTLFFFNTAMSSIAIQISRLLLFLLFSRFSSSVQTPAPPGHDQQIHNPVGLVWATLQTCL
jgi:hypothetical protein